MIKMPDEEFKDYDSNSGIMPADDKPMEAMPVEEHDNMSVNKLSKYNMAKAPGTGNESPYNMAVTDGDQAKEGGANSLLSSMAKELEWVGYHTPNHGTIILKCICKEQAQPHHQWISIGALLQ